MDNRQRAIDKVMDVGLIAIVRGLHPRHMTALADALYLGGIQAMEVTFDQAHPDRQADTVAAIETLADHCRGRMLVGAGTVTNVALVERAHGAGAQFIVSPDTNPQVIKRTLALDMASMPGALTPTEIALAHDAGADFVKVFPAGTLGSGYIKAVRGPLSHIRLLAVGGVDEHNLRAFIEAGCVGAGVGGSLINKQWIEAGAFDKITALARVYVSNLR